MKFSKRTVLITGGTSGIGLELATQLLDRGNTVIVTGRDRSKLDSVQKTLPGINVFQSDVTDPSAITELFESVTRQFPELDTLINNAGIMRNLKLQEDHDLVDLTREVEVGLNGPVRMIQKFLPHLKTRKHALIVNISSGLAFIPFTISPVYSAAKSGLRAYTRCLRSQLEGSGVTVVELDPPGVETPLFRGEFAEEMKGQKGMNVKLLVGKTIAGIEAGKTEIRPGLANVLYVMHRLAPNFMFKQMTNMSKPKPAKA